MRFWRDVGDAMTDALRYQTLADRLNMLYPRDRRRFRPGRHPLSADGARHLFPRSLP